MKVESAVKNNAEENKRNMPITSSKAANTSATSANTSGSAFIQNRRDDSNIVEREALNSDTNLTNSQYRIEFINNFETFQYKKTCAENLCCKQLHNLDKLKRLKQSDANNDKNSLCAFIHSKYQGKGKYLMKIYSIVDLYMICSLLEIPEIEQKLLGLTDLFSTISKNINLM